MIDFINDSDTDELEKNLRIGNTVDDLTRKILSKLFRNIGTPFAKREPVKQF